MISARQLVTTIGALVALVACTGDGLTPPQVSVPDDQRVATLSHGEDVDLAAHLPDEGWTVVEFGAVW